MSENAPDGIHGRETLLAGLRTDAMVRLALGHEDLDRIRVRLRAAAAEAGLDAATADEVLTAAWVERDHLARENADRDRSGAIRRAFARLREQGVTVREDVPSDQGIEETCAYFTRADAESMVDSTDLLRLRLRGGAGLRDRVRAALEAEGVPVRDAGDGALEVPEVSWFPPPPGRGQG